MDAAIATQQTVSGGLRSFHTRLRHALRDRGVEPPVSAKILVKSLDLDVLMVAMTPEWSPPECFADGSAKHDRRPRSRLRKLPKRRNQHSNFTGTCPVRINLATGTCSPVRSDHSRGVSGETLSLRRRRPGHFQRAESGDRARRAHRPGGRIGRGEEHFAASYWAVWTGRRTVRYTSGRMTFVSSRRKPLRSSAIGSWDLSGRFIPCSPNSRRLRT